MPGAGTNGHLEAPPRTAGLLRLATAGSVDDGKSTLIGRLLYDSKSILSDQLDDLHRHGELDLSRLTDGLRAEREQGITIDVAYRYFATPRRRFVVADTPGHKQYTRNMVTGASTAEVAIVLVDARKGVLEQSRRHAFIASLLGIQHIVVCVNKMDLVDYDEAVFDGIEDDFTSFSDRLDIPDVTCIPISALHGDNVVERSEAMPWYDGPPLLYHLEHVHVAADRNLEDLRLPVQWVVRDGAGDYRGYAGQLGAGIVRPGDDVVVLPSGQRSRVAAVDTADGPLEEAFAPQSVTVRLEDELDVSRGDVICGAEGREPLVTRELEATVCWMAERPLTARGRYAIKLATRSARAIVDGVVHRVDVETLGHETGVGELGLNDIGVVRLRTSEPLVVDPYRVSRATGSFILVDEASNETVGAGMVSAA